MANEGEGVRGLPTGVVEWPRAHLNFGGYRPSWGDPSVLACIRDQPSEASGAHHGTRAEQVRAGIRVAQAGATEALAEAQSATQRATAAESLLVRTRAEYQAQPTAMQAALEATQEQAEESQLALEMMVQRVRAEYPPRSTAQR